MTSLKRYSNAGPPLLEAGYPPIPIKPESKIPAVNDWAARPLTPDLVKSWAGNGYASCGVGIRLGNGTIAIDVDITNIRLSNDLGRWICDTLGNGKMPMRRIGQAPKFLIPCLVQGIDKKIASRSYTDPRGKTQRIEILSTGQQFVAYGVHPDTKSEYAWQYGDLLDVKQEDLLELTESDIGRLFDEFYRLAVAAGWKEGQREKAKDTRPESYPTERPMVEHKTTTVTTPYGQKALDAESEKVSSAPEGERNATFNTAVYSIAQLVEGGEIVESEAITKMTAAAEQAGLAPGEIRATLRSGLSSGKQTPRSAPPRQEEPPIPDDSLAPQPEQGNEKPEQPEILDPAALLEEYEVTEIYVNKLGQEEFLHQNLIAKNHVITIIAMPGGGKTSIIFYHVCPYLANKGLTVWYIDADSPASDHKRMKATATEYGFKLLNPDVNALTSMDGLLKTLRKIADSGADLAGWVFIVDTLKKCADLMSKGSVKAFYQLARKLANKGATVILLGHANKFRDKEGNLIFEGVGDVRADSDELIFFERKTNPHGGIDVTTVVDPDKGAKVRGLFEPISFHVSEDREITTYEKPLPTIDRTATAAPRATDDEIVEAARKYLFSRNEPVMQKQLVQHVADMTASGDKRVRQVIVQHSEPKGSMTSKGLPFVYSIGDRNTHTYELPQVKV